jgi:hypothetical protein
MIRSFIAWVLLFVLLAFLCGLISAGPLNDFAYSRVLAPLNVTEGAAAKTSMEQQFGTALPASAADIHRANRGDEFYWLRLSVSPAELPAVFRGSSSVTCRFAWQDRYRPVFEFDRSLNAGEQAQMAWWTAEAAGITAYIGGECTGTDYRIFRAFVDQSNSTRWILYMEIVQL